MSPSWLCLVAFWCDRWDFPGTNWCKLWLKSSASLQCSTVIVHFTEIRSWLKLRYFYKTSTCENICMFIHRIQLSTLPPHWVQFCSFGNKFKTFDIVEIGEMSNSPRWHPKNGPRGEGEVSCNFFLTTCQRLFSDIWCTSIEPWNVPTGLQ